MNNLIAAIAFAPSQICFVRGNLTLPAIKQASSTSFTLRLARTGYSRLL